MRSSRMGCRVTEQSIRDISIHLVIWNNIPTARNPQLHLDKNLKTLKEDIL